ncbi:MAG: epoxyqueuosine reductase QueH [Clostridiales bacterium]|nr:epoxyqueuosine reductase QueH [Clostridiales bacterium]
MKINYQLELDKKLDELGTKKRLLLHCCCAPCSSYVLEYLTDYFDITVFFYNPNITSREEYNKRAAEEKRLISLLPHSNSITFVEGSYEPERFIEQSCGFDQLPEGGERCFRCYRLRLAETAKYMSQHRDEYDYFCTTLTVSPHKNAAKLNEIGFELADEYGVSYLPSDFKKREGYKRSIELSHEYGLYRQDYCGCEYSRNYKRENG